jgi:serine protease Do
VIAEVDPSGAAAEKGLRRGDVIMDVNGKAVSRPADVRSAVEAARKDGRRTVLLRVRSSEGVRFVALAVRPTAG